MAHYIQGQDTYDKAFPEYSLAKGQIYTSYFSIIHIYGQVQDFYLRTGFLHQRKFRVLLSQISSFYMTIRGKMLNREFARAQEIMDSLALRGRVLKWAETKEAISELSRWMDEAGYMDVESKRYSPEAAAKEWS